MKTNLVLLCLLLIFSCKSKKTVTETQMETRSDTVSVVSESSEKTFNGIVIERTRPLYSRTIIEQPCDSTGKLRAVNQVMGSGMNKSSIITRDGKIYIEQYLDSFSDAREKKLVSKFKKDSVNIRKNLVKEFSKTSLKVVYVYPWWVYGAVVGFILFLGLWVWKKLSPYF